MKTKKKSQRKDVLLQERLSGRTEVNAPVGMSNNVREQKLSPHAGTRHFIPRDEQIDGALIGIEKLMRRGNYKAAIREARKIKFDDSSMGSTYALMVHEKIARAQVAIGDRHLAKGNTRQAKLSYQAALTARGADAQTSDFANAARAAIEDTHTQRIELIESFLEMSAELQYEKWCETRSAIHDSNVINKISALIPDMRLADLLGPRVPPNWELRAKPREGWKDPVAIDELADQKGLGGLLIDRPAMRPGASFTALSAKPIALEALRDFSKEAGGAPQARSHFSSSAFPLLGTMLSAFGRIVAIDSGLTYQGRSQGSVVPLFRYSYLVERSRHLLTLISDIDSKMMTMQFELDDFTEWIATITEQIGEHSTEIQALDARIQEFETTLAELSKGQEELGQIVQKLEDAEEQCEEADDLDCGDFAAIAGGVLIGALLLGGGAFVLGADSIVVTEAVVAGLILGGLAGYKIKKWADKDITCENVTQARRDFQQAHSAVTAALLDTGAELLQTLRQRDALYAELASLWDIYYEGLAANQARILNAPTLSHILGVLDGVRRTNMLRAHSLALMAQAAFNAEHDRKVNVISSRHSDYLDEGARGYTAAAVLKRDLDGLEHIRLTGRIRKQMQLTQIVSLREHYPTSLVSLIVAGEARFATRLSNFDEWFPGTYMQRLREVRVEVFVAEEPQPVRGYLTNSGVSFVRFSDYGNHVTIDGSNVIAEPAEDLRKLCYKRRRRHHTVETMAFPHSDSFLYEARAIETQAQERNFFEGCGLESTWHLELLPDQSFEPARITDVKIHFQFDAMFDPALKRVVAAKRYTDRKETALVSVRKLLEAQKVAVDFSQPIKANITPFMFEAPHVNKTIRDVRLILWTKQGALLSDKARLRLSYQENDAIELQTNKRGIVSTSNKSPAGTKLTALRAQTHGKTIAGSWAIELHELPPGLHVEDIEDVLLMIRYTFEPD